MVERTHLCGELRLDDVGQTVTLQGWVRALRNHGGLVFLDLWDREGTTQVVADPRFSREAHAVAREVGNEDVVTVRGVVRRRPSGTENPALATGEIEVAAAEIEILARAAPLPFPIEEASQVDESLRLRYRYLDLRRGALQDNLRLRHRLLRGFRDYLDGEGFLEVETPMLTRSTPEGARDYLVPSRSYPGHFYALPQSPQQMKQLLMVAGVDRYFQVARCFRDEDLRVDRQPEFTQLDLEMSFVEQEEILSLVEAMVVEVVGAVSPERSVAAPFPRLTYDEAMGRYGTDKPDLRLGDRDRLAFAWVVDFPLLRWNEEAKRWDAQHHPFTSPKPEDIPLLDADPGAVRASSYDLVCNGWELGSGSIRLHRRELQERVLRLLGYSPQAMEAGFGHLLEALDFGAPPHGGIALGIDRLVAILAGTDTIRDVIAFPKTRQAADLVMRAPAPVLPSQLQEVHIKVIAEEKRALPVGMDR